MNKIKLNLQKSKSELEIKKSEAWSKITNTILFIAEVEILATMNDMNIDDATDIIKDKLFNDEEYKQKFYNIINIRESMDLLNLKPYKKID
jgi:hypothetical protein